MKKRIVFALTILGALIQPQPVHSAYSVEGKNVLTGEKQIYQYPFNPNDIEDVKAYFNQVTWKDGSQREFFNLRNCQLESLWSAWYECNADYKETNPLGTRICINVSLTYNDGASFKDADVREPCGPYTQVQPEPEPQPTPTPPAQPEIQPATPADQLNFTTAQVAIGAGSFFLIGGIFGVAIGFTAGKKKSSWEEL